MRTRGVLCAAACCIFLLVTQGFAFDELNHLQTQLRKIYEHQLLSLKNPDCGKSIEFDGSGKLITEAVPGPWSICGLLQVQKIALTSQYVEISGNRVILTLRAAGKASQPADPPSQVTPIMVGQRLRVVVRLGSTPADVADLDRALSQAFQGGSLLARVASYWKPKTTDLEAFRRDRPDAMVGELEGGRPVFLVNPKAMRPPAPIKTPDPTYTESARRKRITGNVTLIAVINEQGVPEILEVEKGLEEGLDTEALIAVAGWKFQPPMKDGQPVSVLIHVEISFRLN